MATVILVQLNGLYSPADIHRIIITVGQGLYCGTIGGDTVKEDTVGA